jgi:hypothetical protein
LNRTVDPGALEHVAAASPPAADTAPSPRIDSWPSPEGDGDGAGEGCGAGGGGGGGCGEGEDSGEGGVGGTGAGPLEGEGDGDGAAAGDVDGDGDGGGGVFGDGEGGVRPALERAGDGDGEADGRTESGTGALVPAVWVVDGLADTPGGCAARREGVILVTITHHDSAGSETMSVTRYFHTPASAWYAVSEIGGAADARSAKSVPSGR